MTAMHAFCTFAMTGLIWFVQIVHYPLFASVGRERFIDYEKRHAQRTTWVVAPLMLGELFTLAWLWQHGQRQAVGQWPGVALLALIWISTGLIQVPLHSRLERGFDEMAARRLVASNWIRTLAWSARSWLLWGGGVI